jgi:hypothetical protein
MGVPSKVEIALARLHAARVPLVLATGCMRLAQQMLLGAPTPRPKHMKLRALSASASLAVSDGAADGVEVRYR